MDEQTANYGPFIRQLWLDAHDSGVSFGTIAGRIERYFEQHGLGLSEVRP
jgi:hypothetical protein